MMKRAILILSLLLSVLCKPQAQVMMLLSSDSLFNITSPLDLDSLFYWFAADVGVTDSLGGAITTDEGVGTWNDLSGNGHHVTQTTDGARPVYKATGGPGSKPCIQFDGTNDFLASAAHWWGSDDLTVIVVMKFANATRDATETTVTRLNDTNNRQIDFQFRGAANSYDGRMIIHPDGTNTPNTSATTGANYKHANYRLQYWSFNGSSDFTLTTDGSSTSVTIAGTSNTIYDNSQALLVGARLTSSPTNFLWGSISEIIVYSRALSSTERAAIENYLNKKYDLYAAADSTRDELLKGPRTPSKILTAYETLRHIDAYKCALNDMNRDEIEQYLSRKYTLYYLIILGFPLASARRRKLIPNEKKNAA